MKSKKRKLVPLDYLLIPTGWGRQRKKRTIKELENREVKNIFILNGCDSEEDILYLGKKLKGKKKIRIGIVTFPLHYLEYKDLIKKAQKTKKFPKKIITENIATEQTLKQTIYGVLGLIEEKLDKKINYTSEEHMGKVLAKIKGKVIHFLKH
ncbi:Uncharacterised protein [uncultured archaeon]|nr:Uncharacterised protein [uncultured archaeon]